MHPSLPSSLSICQSVCLSPLLYASVSLPHSSKERRCLYPRHPPSQATSTRMMDGAEHEKWHAIPVRTLPNELFIRPSTSYEIRRHMNPAVAASVATRATRAEGGAVPRIRSVRRDDHDGIKRISVAGGEPRRPRFFCVLERQSSQPLRSHPSVSQPASRSTSQSKC